MNIHNVGRAQQVTYTGRCVDIFNLRPVDIDIIDIAHSLSLQTRYNGHCIGFYSVAEHCVLLCDYIQREFPGDVDLQRWALLHDAAEAYIGDTIAPIKALMPWFVELEHKIMRTIKSAYKLGPEPDAFKALDLRIRADEISQNTHDPSKFETYHPLGIRLEFLPPAYAEARFLSHFNRLFKVANEQGA